MYQAGTLVAALWSSAYSGFRRPSTWLSGNGPGQTLVCITGPAAPASWFVKGIVFWEIKPNDFRGETWKMVDTVISHECSALCGEMGTYFGSKLGSWSVTLI